MKRKSNLAIDSEQTIESVSTAFNKAFPYLRLGFFKKPHVKGKGSSKSSMYLSNVRIGQIQKKTNSGYCSLSPDLSVAELENDLESKFGLYAQVFRKSGNVWLETSATDDWTLEQQNTEGISLDMHLKEEKEDFQDHDVW